MAYGDIAWADFDNDGDQDVLLSGALADGTFVSDVFRNTDGEFEAIGSGLPNPAFSSADWGDYDGDGDLDLVFSGGQLAPLIFDGLLHVYRNDDGILTRVADLLPTSTGMLEWGDYDSDGDPDIVVAGSRNAAGGKGVRILQNNGDEIFTELTYLTGVSFASVDFADYDGDLDPDILVSGLDREGALLGLYRNDVRIPNTIPSAPAGLTSTASGGITTLSWELRRTSSQSGSLTYNVRVGTTPGAGDIVSATTAGTTSRRLISANGNADQATSINLRLPNGSYYWTVQAIDASFAASDFAAELPLNVTGKGTASGNEDGPGELMFALGALIRIRHLAV